LCFGWHSIHPADFIKDVLPFNNLRPFHVTSVFLLFFWITLLIAGVKKVFG